MILHQLQLPQNQSVLITSCNKGAELAVPNCVVALLAARGGILLGVDLITCSSLNQGGGGSLTIGRHKRYIPLSGLSVLWHLVGDLRVSCTPSMESFVTACHRLKGLLYSINGGFWLMYVIDLWVSCTPSMESFVTVCPKLKSLLYSFEMEFVTVCPR